MKYTPTHVLGIDQAAVSGWAIAAVGANVQRHGHGIAKDGAQRECVVHQAVLIAGGAERLLVVYEDHSDITIFNKARYDRKTHEGPKRNAGTLIGMGRALGRWDGLLDAAKHPEKLRLGVHTRDWRARVLGVGQSIGTDALKARALLWASQHVGENLTDHNEAEGICICAWGAIDGVAVLESQRKATRMVSRVKRAAQKQLALEEGS